MAAPKSSSYRGWFFDRENSTLDLYVGLGGASDPAEIARASTTELTLTGNLAVTGTTAFSGHASFGDAISAKFGASDDLEINHSGANSFIQETGTGSLYIDSSKFYFRDQANSNANLLTMSSTGVLIFHASSAEKFSTLSGGVKITGAIQMTVSADPSTATDQAHIYCKDDPAEIYVRDEAGNVTKISPHNDDGEWEFYSHNSTTGKTFRVNMERMIRQLEEITGESFIKEDEQGVV